MNSTRRVWQEFAPVRTRLLGAAALGTVTTLSNIALLSTSGWLIARAAQMPPVLDLSIAVVAVRTFALSRSVTRYAERLVSHDATFRAVTGIRVKLFVALEHMAPRGMTRRGDVLTRAVADVDSLQDLPLRVVLPGIAALVSALMTVCGLFLIDATTAGIIALGLTLAATLVPWSAHRAAVTSQQALAAKRAELASEWVDLVDGRLDITMLGLSAEALDRMTHIDSQLTASARRHARATGISSALLTAIQGGTLIAVCVGIAHTQPGPVMSVLLGLLPLAVFETVAALPNCVLALAAVTGSADRICELLDEPVVEEPTGDKTWSRADLDVDAIAAQWTPGVAAIHDVSLKSPLGTRLALMGASGSGKSTALAVLAALLRPSRGTYRIGGQDSAHAAGDQVRSSIVLVSQDSHIFATSIAENLRMVRPATDEELLKVLDSVRLGQWVRDLPGGIHTVLGEFGATMSGGQRQRLNVARLILASPDVWLLDEPTEHLDAELADDLMATVAELAGKASVVVATHRNADTAICDQTIRLADGTMES